MNGSAAGVVTDANCTNINVILHDAKNDLTTYHSVRVQLPSSALSLPWGAGEVGGCRWA